VDECPGLDRHAAGEFAGGTVTDLLGPALGLPDRVLGDREIGRERQLLQADDAGTGAGRQPDAFGEQVLVGDRILMPGLLDGADPEGLALGVVHPRQ